MVKFLRVISIFLIYLIPFGLFVLFSGILLGRISVEFILNGIERISNHPFSFFIYLFGAFVSFLVFFVSLCGRWIYESKNKKFFIKNPDGMVSMSLKTIEDFIVRLSKDYVEIKELSPQIRAHKNSISIQLMVKIWAGSNVPAATERVQRQIKLQIQNVLGIENIKTIDIQIEEIIGKKTSVDKLKNSGKQFNERILEGNEV